MSWVPNNVVILIVRVPCIKETVTLLNSTMVPWDLFRSFNVCSDAKERVGCGKQREATASIQFLVKLQPWLPSLQWMTCLPQNCSLGSCACSEGPTFGQNTDDDPNKFFKVCPILHRI